MGKLFAHSFFVISSAVFLFSCTRATEEVKPTSLIKIVAPDRKAVAEKLDVAGLAFPSGIQVCYGVSVVASDLPETKSSCSGSMGLFGGFVAGGGQLSLLVPRGESRTITLYAYLTEPAASCPAWNTGFHENGANYLKTYRVGTAVGVSTMSDVSVEITASFNGLQSSVAAENPGASCGGASAGTLRALLYYDGTVVNPAVPESAAFYRPALDAIVQLISGIFTENAFSLVTNTGASLNASGTETYLPYLHSFAKKPDGSAVYALMPDNLIVKVTGASSYEELATCPFDVPGCRLPAWVQSMSPGMGTDMFALDHAGIIYKASAQGLVATGTTVLPSVRQITYY